MRFVSHPLLLALTCSPFASACVESTTGGQAPKATGDDDTGVDTAADGHGDDSDPRDSAPHTDTAPADTGTIDTGDPSQEPACPDAVATCAGHTCTFDVDLVGYALGGTLGYDGGALPDSGDRSGADYVVWVVDQRSGGTIQGEFVFDQPWSFTLPAATYDVFARLLVHGRETHMGAAVQIAEALVVDAATTLDANLVPHAVGGSASLAGGAIPDTRDADDYAVRLVDAAGNEVEAEFGAAQPWAMLVPQGRYGLWMRIHGGNSAAEREWAWAGEVDVAADTVYNIDATFPVVSGHPTLDGADLADGNTGPDEDYTVELTELTTRERFDGAFHHDEDVQIQVPAGVYDVELTVWYPPAGDGSSYVRLTNPAVSLLADGTLDLAVDTVTAGGTVSLDGAEVPDTPFDLDYCVQFTGSDGLASGRTCAAAGEPWSARLPPGTYDIDVKLATDQGDATGGRPPHRVATGIGLIDASDFSFDVSFATLSGRFSYASGPMPNPMADPREAYAVTATDVDTGTTYTGRFPFSQPYSLTQPTGVYDVEVRILARGASAIVTETFLAASDMVVSGNTTLHADIPVVQLRGEVRYQGFLLDGLPRHDFSVNLSSDDGFDLSRRFPATEGYAMRLWPGTYELYAGLAAQSRESDLDGGVLVARCLLVQP